MEKPATNLRQSLRNVDAVSIGVWSNLDDPLVAHSVAAAGFDWFCLDEQHGNASGLHSAEALSAVAATGTHTLVRVAWNRPELIGRALDSGADGVIVPMVQSAQEAQLAARAVRYAPVGERSWGPGRMGYAHAARGPEEANDATACLAMVETPRAVERVSEIAAVDGVDGIFVGPYDLSIAYGTDMDALLADHSEHSPLTRVAEACRANGVVAGGYAGSLERAKSLVAHGFTMVVVAADTELLLTAARSAVVSARESI